MWRRRLATSAGALKREVSIKDASQPLSRAVRMVIKATTPVVSRHEIKFGELFYKNLFKNNPETRKFFNEAHLGKGLQQRAFTDAIVRFASFIETPEKFAPTLERISHRHCALGVTPDLYPAFHSNLMKSMYEMFGEAVSPEIGDAWNKSLTFLIERCIRSDEMQYGKMESRKGGWRGEAPFIVSEKEKFGKEAIRFRFVRADGYKDGFEFTPGQYLTIRGENAVPRRHYTITSAPGEPHFDIVTREIKGGEMSGFLKKHLKVGSTVLAAAPCGHFVAKDNFSHVFISAGIGITPIYALMRSLGKDQTSALYHVDTCINKHVLRNEILDLGIHDVNFIYSDTEELNLREDIETLFHRYSIAASYYISAPADFALEVYEILKRAGVNDISVQSFQTGKVDHPDPLKMPPPETLIHVVQPSYAGTD